MNSIIQYNTNYKYFVCDNVLLHTFTGTNYVHAQWKLYTAAKYAPV